MTTSSTVQVSPGLERHPSSVPSLVDQLLRDVGGTLQRIASDQQLARLARAMMVTIFVGGGLFGAAMGAYRGGAQIVYAAIKLPLAMLLTTAICAPALSSLHAALGRNAHLRRDLALVLCALGRASLVLGALAPVVLLAVRFDVGYHDLILLVVACCALAGLIGLSLFWRGLGQQPTDGTGRSSPTAAEAPSASAPTDGTPVTRPVPGRSWVAAVALLGVFGLVGTQMAWTLRPFVLRPRTVHIPLVRSVEDSFLESVLVSWQSARGIYWREAAPLPEAELERESAR